MAAMRVFALIALVVASQFILSGRFNRMFFARDVDPSFFQSKSCDMTVPSSESVKCLAKIVRSNRFHTSTLIVRSDLAWLSNATGIATKVVNSSETRAYESISNNVVLDMPCSEEELSVPTLMDLVPGYTNRLTVLLPNKCNQEKPIFPHWADDDLTDDERRLRSFFHRAFPHTNVTLVHCDHDNKANSTESCIDIMLMADLLVCALPSVECMVAAVTSLNAATVMSSPKLYPWLSSITEQSRSFFIYKRDDDNSRNKTTNRPPMKCNHMRGRLGTWKYNPVYANKTYYYERWWIFAKDYEQRPHSHSSYSWEDYCGMSLMTLDGFCQSMKALDIRRMFVLGDSLQFMSMISFFHLLGFETDHPHTKELHNHLKPRSAMKSHTTLECPSFSIDIVFYRVNHYTPLLGKNATTGRNQTQRAQDFMERAKEDEEINSKEYFVCYGIRKPLWPDEEGNCPWVHDYLSNPVRTLVLTGVGAHFHSLKAYKESLDQFMDLLQKNPRPNDIIWFRTTNPGHDGTFNQSELFESYQAYKEQAWTTKYNWDLFVQYNKYTEEQVFRKGPQMALLDIYWMTALRKDGHPSVKDGLHYLLPGPPDWWNHLLYSNLHELAQRSVGK